MVKGTLKKILLLTAIPLIILGCKSISGKRDEVINKFLRQNGLQSHMKLNSYASGDLNGDGSKDMIVGSLRNVYRFDNKGSTIDPELDYKGVIQENDSFFPQAFSVAIGDINWDGLNDIVTLSGRNLTYFENKGNNKFERHDTKIPLLDAHYGRSAGMNIIDGDVVVGDGQFANKYRVQPKISN